MSSSNIPDGSNVCKREFNFIPMNGGCGVVVVFVFVVVLEFVFGLDIGDVVSVVVVDVDDDGIVEDGSGG